MVVISQRADLARVAKFTRDLLRVWRYTSRRGVVTDSHSLASGLSSEILKLCGGLTRASNASTAEITGFTLSLCDVGGAAGCGGSACVVASGNVVARSLSQIGCKSVGE